MQSWAPPPLPKVTGMIKPDVTGDYASTNAAYREHVIKRYSNPNSPSDPSKVYSDGHPIVTQPGHLSDVHLVNDNEELVLVPFRDTVNLHHKIVPVPCCNNQIASSHDTVFEHPELGRIASPPNRLT